MRSGVLCSTRGSSGRRIKAILPVKVSMVFLFLSLILSPQIFAQKLTIVNNTKTLVHFKVFGSDKNTCNNKFSSLTTSVEPGAKLSYQSSEINWSNERPGDAFEFSYMDVVYIDPSGACETYSSNHIGESRCDHSKGATLSPVKCGAKPGNLNLVWTSKNGNVLVTIN
jgi:hypothetical protein